MGNFVTYAIVMIAPTRLDNKDVVVMRGDNEKNIKEHMEELRRDYPDRKFELFHSHEGEGEEEKQFEGEIPQECPCCGEELYKQCIPPVSNGEVHAEVLYDCGSTFRVYKNGAIASAFRSGYCYNGEIRKLEDRIEELSD